MKYMKINEMFKKKKKLRKHESYGGIVYNGKNILIREPAGHFGGYVWTFPKGRRGEGDTPEETAIREVYEETGYRAVIVKKLPLKLETASSVTQYYLMKPASAVRPDSFDEETASIKWVTLERARQLINMTWNTRGKKRDREVIDYLETMPEFKNKEPEIQ